MPFSLAGDCLSINSGKGAGGQQSQPRAGLSILRSTAGLRWWNKLPCWRTSLGISPGAARGPFGPAESVWQHRMATDFSIQTQWWTRRPARAGVCSGQGSVGTSSVLSFNASCLIFAAWWRVPATLIDDTDLQRAVIPGGRGGLIKAVPRAVPANARPSRTTLALSWIYGPSYHPSA